jgi:hypothetical protein
VTALNSPEGIDSANVNVWVRVTNRNANESQMQNVFVAVGSAGSGFYEARFVPFDKPWKVPWALVQELRNRKMQVHTEEIDGETGKKTKMRAKQVPHYTVEILNKDFVE